MPSHRFILQAFDMTLWCSIAEAAFEVSDLESLRGILGEMAADDPELADEYTIEGADKLAMFGTKFDVGFPIDVTSRPDIEISVSKMTWSSLADIPYVSHTSCELFLMIDGRKPLAKMYHEYPPRKFAGEDSFDRWVDKGVLIKEVEFEPYEEPREQFEGVRTAYYAVKGEEWRIQATKLIWRASRQAGGWNEYYERLEGMLFGYEDWQNDWWIENRRGRRRR